MTTVENLKRENEKLREDYLKARDELNVKENHYEARVNNLEFQLNEKDKEDKLLLDKILNEHKIAVKELNANWERRVEELERRNTSLSNDKETIELELQRVIDSISIIKQEHLLELKDTQDRIYDQEFHRYEDIVQGLNAKIRLLEEGREHATRAANEDSKSAISREKKLQESLLRAEAELNHLKNERVSYMGQLSDLKESNERLKGDLSNRDKIIYKLETELSELHSLLQTTKDAHERDLGSMLSEHRRERTNWDMLREGTFASSRPTAQDRGTGKSATNEGDPDPRHAGRHSEADRRVANQRHEGHIRDLRGKPRLLINTIL